MELFCDADTGIFDLTFTWYRNKEQLQDDSVVVLDQMEPTLNITAIGRAHQGGYACQIHLESRTVKSELSNTVNIAVYGEYQFKIVSITKTEVRMDLLGFIVLSLCILVYHTIYIHSYCDKIRDS